MLKWILTLVVVIFLLGICTPPLARALRFRRLPGDLRIRFRGQTYSFPFASALLLSLFAYLVGRIL